MCASLTLEPGKIYQTEDGVVVKVTQRKDQEGFSHTHPYIGSNCHHYDVFGHIFGVVDSIHTLVKPVSL